jgi:hypothetical protein
MHHIYARDICLFSFTDSRQACNQRGLFEGTPFILHKVLYKCDTLPAIPTKLCESHNCPPPPPSIGKILVAGYQLNCVGSIAFIFIAY